MLFSGKGYAQNMSSGKRIWSEHILFEEDMLSQEMICSLVAKDLRTYPLMKRICSGLILFEGDMLSQERICFLVAKDMHWIYPL